MSAQEGLVDWEKAAPEICEKLLAQMPDVLSRITGDIYERLMRETQDYLQENVEFNLKSQLDAANRQAQADREARTSLESELVEARRRETFYIERDAKHGFEIFGLRNDNANLRKVLTRSENGWSNAIELGLIPDQHVMSATILRDEARAALAGHKQAEPTMTAEEMREAIRKWLLSEIQLAQSAQRNAFASGSDRQGEKHHSRHCALFEVKQFVESLPASPGKGAE